MEKLLWGSVSQHHKIQLLRASSSWSLNLFSGGEEEKKSGPPTEDVSHSLLHQSPFNYSENSSSLTV